MFKINLFNVSLTQIHLSIYSRSTCRLITFLYISNSIKAYMQKLSAQCIFNFQIRNSVPTITNEGLRAGDSYKINSQNSAK